MIHLFCYAFTASVRCLLYRFQRKTDLNSTIQATGALFWCIFGGALLLRLLLAYTTHGFGNDIACFAAWADRIFTLGPGHSYSAECFTDYPPRIHVCPVSHRGDCVPCLGSLLFQPAYHAVKAACYSVRHGLRLSALQRGVKKTAFFRNAICMCSLCLSVPAGNHL